MGDPQLTFGWGMGQAVLDPKLEYFRKNRWVLEIVPPLSVEPEGVSGPLAKGLRINCATAARPSINFEETRVERINGRIYLAGKPTYEPLTVAFYDSIPIGEVGILTPSFALEAWRRQIYAPEKGDAFGSVVNYKGVARLHMLQPHPSGAALASEADPGGGGLDPIEFEESIAQTWQIDGIFPQTINYGDLDYASSDVQQVEVTFRYDRAISLNTRGPGFSSEPES